MSVRWDCPNGCGGVLGPERPRRDDVRRYCLECSRRTGRLVPRVAPSLERKRASAALRSTEKRKAKAERDRLARTTLLRNARGEEVRVDLVAETRRALREMGYGWPASIDVTVRRRRDGLYSGRAYPYEDRIVLSIGTQVGSYEDALVIAYHEAAHIAAGPDASDPRGRNWHGERFQKTLATALQNRWSFVRYGSLRQQSGYEPGEAVRGQLRAYVRNGGEL